jgi:hypothetical protein
MLNNEGGSRPSKSPKSSPPNQDGLKRRRKYPLFYQTGERPLPIRKAGAVYYDLSVRFYCVRYRPYRTKNTPLVARHLAPVLPDCVLCSSLSAMLNHVFWYQSHGLSPFCLKKFPYSIRPMNITDPMLYASFNNEEKFGKELLFGLYIS